ncbi:ABC transporter permease [Bradyrhizobium zhanjiangense]|uniref:ABC transporter permease n=1 Tax=Bradyrhizobium zhanjiangense TaxID=1325107 RepID=UPI0013E8EF38|nr:ABC transporter permease [Bradyrhizobium zhanjiangense]
MLDHSISPRRMVGTLLSYRGLIGRLLVREFSAKYRGSIMGVLWAVVTPLVMALVFLFVFGVVFQSRWGVEQAQKATFTVTLLIGMVVHGIFSEALSRSPTIVLGNPSFVKKVVFPLEILPIVAVLNALVTASIGLAIVVIVHFAMSGTFSPTLPLLPLVLLPYLLAVLGLVYFLSSVGVYLRDLMQLTGLITMASMFMTPIFYPITAVPEPYRTVLYLNPVTFAVEQARGVALYGEPPDWQGLAIFTLAGAALAWLGYAWFQKTRKGFADVL